jgi:hypothetical protein
MPHPCAVALTSRVKGRSVDAMPSVLHREGRDHRHPGRFPGSIRPLMGAASRRRRRRLGAGGGMLWILGFLLVTLAFNSWSASQVAA